MEIARYFDAVKERYELSSDYALAEKLGIAQPEANLMRRGLKIPKPELCIKMAKLLDKNPVELLLIAQKDKAPKQAKEYWTLALTAVDVMLHVPTDPELARRNKEVVIANPYFLETIAVAINPERVPSDSSFDAFKTRKIGVKLATVSDYFLMTYEDGALINNIAHFIKGPQGAKEFMNGETAALMGVRSEIEGTLFEAGASAPFIAPNMDGIVRRDWTIGMAVDERSRDLGYALGDALQKMQSSNTLKSIFANYGVTYIPPPGS